MNFGRTIELIRLISIFCTARILKISSAISNKFLLIDDKFCVFFVHSHGTEHKNHIYRQCASTLDELYEYSNKYLIIEAVVCFLTFQIFTIYM